ncbi:hypothetical protein RKD27_004942 [Streptomyces sp. SAI-126]|uniref:hypothetical protein n=1 Tax=Streptomyces sp. SAI-126 TaxID=3377732 RepID=UPI003C7D73C9
MPQRDQTGGEGVGLLGGERGQPQAAVGRQTVEGGLDLTRPLQQTEHGTLGVVRGRPTGAKSRGPGQLHDVRDGARAQELPGPGEELVDVFGQVPVVRTHAS